MRLDIERAITGAVVVSGLFLAVSGMTTAEASPLTCEHRSAAHIAEHGGRLADDRWHVSHGQLPNCDEQKPAEDNKHDNQDDVKSRYCRKHFFC